MSKGKLPILGGKMSDNNSNLITDLNALRLSQDFESTAGVKKILATIPVRKPDRQSWIRVHPDEEMRIETAVLEYKEERATYLVDRPLWGDLRNELIPKVIFIVIDTLGQVSMWPIKMPVADGRIDEWNRSAMRGAIEAQKHWVRIAADQGKGAYDIFCAEIQRPEPQWPDKTLQELLQIAFKDRFIKSMDHPVVLRLLGKSS
jgi:hypothetical protein